MPGWVFGLICAVGPALWAVAVVRAIRAREAKKAGFGAVDKPPSDYSI